MTDYPPLSPTDEALRAWARTTEKYSPGDEIRHHFPPYYLDDHDEIIQAMATELLAFRTRTGTGNPITGASHTRTFPDGTVHRYNANGEQIDAHGNYIDEE